MPRGKPRSGFRRPRNGWSVEDRQRMWADDNDWMDSLRFPVAEPIHALLRAILLRAVRDACATVHTAKPTGTLPTLEDSANAVAWIFGESDGNVPYSAQWICDALGLPLDQYRKGTRKAIEDRSSIPGLENHCSSRRTLGI